MSQVGTSRRKKLLVRPSPNSFCHLATCWSSLDSNTIVFETSPMISVTNVAAPGNRTFNASSAAMRFSVHAIPHLFAFLLFTMSTSASSPEMYPVLNLLAARFSPATLFSRAVKSSLYISSRACLVNASVKCSNESTRVQVAKQGIFGTLSLRESSDSVPAASKASELLPFALHIAKIASADRIELLRRSCSNAADPLTNFTTWLESD
mmetsp:Transcript_18131/g.72579  ORF Transcript_18131/g.72579 Transcript_18131/m.72579 type:complete len:208 (-) Transcript_18131:1279-1902(-)